MENEKWSWFAGGVVLGLLLGLGIAGSYGWSRMNAERARALEAEEQAHLLAAQSREMEALAKQAEAEARELLRRTEEKLNKKP